MQFIEHTAAGTRTGTTGSATFEFDWTPPATNIGIVTFYVAANAANGTGSTDGDRIYTTSASLQPASGGSAPTISAVERDGAFVGGISPNTWVAVKGSNLAATTRVWAGSDFAGNNLPTEIDGVRVTFGGKMGFVYFVSPAQINALAPAPNDLPTGPVNVQVTSNSVASASFTSTVQSLTPAFFIFRGAAFGADDGRYIIATVGSQIILKPGVIPGTRSARPGDVIEIWSTGFGQTTPDVPNGVIPTTRPVRANVTATIGGLPATVTFAGLVGPGVYQINIRVPDLLNGDYEVVVTADGTTAQRNAFITVQRSAAASGEPQPPPDSEPPAPYSAGQKRTGQR